MGRNRCLALITFVAVSLMANLAHAGLSATTPSGGNYTVSWTPVSGAFKYQLIENSSIDYEGTAWSKAYTNKSTGTYVYELDYCQMVWIPFGGGGGTWVEQCGLDSGYGTVTVNVATTPATPTGLYAPKFDLNGAYSISWNASSGATEYHWRVRPSGGSWSQYTTSSLSASVSSQSNSSYEYQVRACTGSSNCSAWSASERTTVEDESAALYADVNFSGTSLSGTIPFHPSVDRKGNSNVSIPLRVPPGVNGLHPNLALTYSSGVQSDMAEMKTTEGVLGYGWKLSGLSEIRRCRIGVGGDVQHNTVDQLCMDGQRLKLISGSSYWADNAEYRTEIQSYVKIKAKGTGLNARWFEVSRPDGSVSEYGNHSEARVTAAGKTAPYLWSITERKDDYNNVMTFTYRKVAAAGTNFITYISYGGSRIDFRYRERCTTTGCDWEAVQGGVEGVTHRGVALNRILTRADSKWVADYRLDNNYDSGNDYLRLEGLQQCGYSITGGSSQCLAPLDFEWEILSVNVDGFWGDQNVVKTVTNSFGDATKFKHVVIDGSGSGNHGYHGGHTSWFGAYTQPPTTTTRANTQRTIVNYLQRPDGKGGLSTEYVRYLGYPLYHLDGRGFVGFPAIRTDFRYQEVTDPDSGNTFQARRLEYRQYRLGFPYTGRLARKRVRVDTDESGSNVWRELERYEWGWAATWRHNGATVIVHPERSYVRNIEENATGGTNSYSAIEREHTYCFRALSAGVCPASGTLLEFPTQLKTVSKQGISLGAQGFGSFWGEVGDRTLHSQSHHHQTTANYVNDAANWTLGFVGELEEGYGTTSVTLTETTEFTKEKVDSLKLGSSTVFPSDAVHELTQTFNYNGNGNLTSHVTSGVGITSRTTSFGSFASSRYPQSITNAESHGSSATYDLRFGTPKTITDPNGNVTTINRDCLGREVTRIHEDGTTVNTSYSQCLGSSGCSEVTWAKARLKITQTFMNGSTKVAPTRVTYIDTAGNNVLTEEEAFSSSDGWVRVRRDYDDTGQLIEESLPYFSNGGSPKLIDYRYDYRKRLVGVYRPDGSSTTTDYVGYYGGLNVTTTESSTGDQRRLVFNRLGQIQTAIDGYGSSDEVTTTYTYTPRMNLDVVTVDGKQVANLDYDTAGNRDQIIEPNTGTMLFTYDSLRQLKQMTDGKGQKTQYSYDKLGRQTQRIDGYLGSAAVTNTWTWDGASNGVGYLSSRTNGAAFTESYTYTSDSKLNTVTASVNVSGFADNGPYVNDYGYDSAGRLSTIAYPNVTATHTYTSRGYLSQIKNGSTVVQTFNDVDAFGNVTSESYGNGINTLRAYDPNTGRLTSIETGKSATPKSVQDLLYNWRADGALLLRTDQRGTSSTSDDQVETFTYDDLVRLKTSTTAVHNRVLTNAFDDYGNLTSKTSNRSGDLDVTSYAYGTSSKPHRLTSVSIGGTSNTLVYDGNGSITRYNASSGDDTYIDYDRANRVTKITVGSSSTTSSPTARDEFWYGPDGERYLRKATWMDGSLKTRWTLYLFGDAFEEVHPEGQFDWVQRTQFSATVTHTRRKNNSGSITTGYHYIHRDHLGSVQTLTDASGNLIDRMGTDPFGGRREDDWSNDIPATDLDFIRDTIEPYHSGGGFTGHEELSRTGFIHMNGRVFDPRIGRFVQADPIVQAPYNSQSYNRYAYTFNNPLAYTDPSGFAGESLGDEYDGFGGPSGYAHFPWAPSPFQRLERFYTWSNDGQIISNALGNGEAPLGMIGLGSNYWTNSGFVSTQTVADLAGIFFPVAECIGTEEGCEFSDYAWSAAGLIPVGAVVGGIVKLGVYGAKVIKAKRAANAAEEVTRGGGEDLIRVRHHTSPEGARGIRNDGAINSGRGDPVGVHVETAPFGPAKTASQETGAFGKGRFVEFEVPRNSVQPTNVGPRNTGVIPSDTPLDIRNLNPKFRRQ